MFILYYGKLKYIPTNVILGVAITFFTAVVAAAAATAGVVVGAAGLATVAVLAAEEAAVVALVEPTTTGSEDGMGFPSFVCNFRTYVENTP